MTVERHFETLTVEATADLTGMMFRAIDQAGIGAATSATTRGFLRNKAFTGDHATLAYKGDMKVYAGAAVTSGAQVGVTTSGWVITVTTSAYVGYAMHNASSGALLRIVGDCNMGLIA